MLKQIRWNKKRKWINTRYAKPFKARQAIKHMMAAQSLAVSIASMSQAQSASAVTAYDKLSKGVRVAIIAIQAFTSVNKILKG